MADAESDHESVSDSETGDAEEVVVAGLETRLICPGYVDPTRPGEENPFLDRAQKMTEELKQMFDVYITGDYLGPPQERRAVPSDTDLARNDITTTTNLFRDMIVCRASSKPSVADQIKRIEADGRPVLTAAENTKEKRAIDKARLNDRVMSIKGHLAKKSRTYTDLKATIICPCYCPKSVDGCEYDLPPRWKSDIRATFQPPPNHIPPKTPLQLWTVIAVAAHVGADRMYRASRAGAERVLGQGTEFLASIMKHLSTIALPEPGGAQIDPNASAANASASAERFAAGATAANAAAAVEKDNPPVRILPKRDQKEPKEVSRKTKLTPGLHVWVPYDHWKNLPAFKLEEVMVKHSRGVLQKQIKIVTCHGKKKKKTTVMWKIAYYNLLRIYQETDLNKETEDDDAISAGEVSLMLVEPISNKAYHQELLDMEA